MNILTKYTKTSLAKNKTRTAVTIIGIMLAVAMFTAVTEAIVSAQQFLVDYIEQTVGSYHAYASELEDDELSALTKEKGVSKWTSLENIGYAEVGSENIYKPYLYVASMSENFTDLVAVNLISGRLPQSSDEILLPYHLFENGNVSFAVGEKIDLAVGTRQFEGFDLYQSSAYQEGESLVNTNPQRYTVVGFYERFDYSIENYTSPGYTALTVGKEGVNSDLFFKFRYITGARDRVTELFEKYPTVTANNDLLRMHGSFGSSAVMNMVGGFAAILIGLIMFGSVSLIYNSFSISVGERTKQFGMLKSVGATRAQIRSAVLKEALMLCTVGVPLGLIAGCAGIGITLHCISDKFSLMLAKLYSGSSAVEVRISLHLSFAAITIAAVIGVVTALISAYIPARRAVKITPIEAVRQSSDIKISRRGRFKKFTITRKIFGFEGMIAAKNFARHKKRYRAAVASMFMSVLLFISASSFCDYLTNAVDVVANDVGYDIKTNISWNTERDIDFLLDIENAKKSAYCGETSADVYISDDMLDPTYVKAFTGKFVHNVSVVFVDNQNYQRLVDENKLRDNGGAVIINQHRYYDENRRVTVFPVVDEKKTGDRITVSVPKDVDGYYYSYFDGTAFNYFEKTDGNIQQQMELPFEEALTDVEITVAGFIDRRPFFVENNELVAIYPVSKMPEEYGAGEAFYVTDDFSACQKELEQELTNRSIGFSIHNNAEENATNRAIATVINVFSYGFIILISLIALANVFNTVTTNIYLRRRELAMIKAVGITSGGFNRMMNYECVICGARSLMYALPASVAVTYLIYLSANSGFGTDFYMPLYSVAVAVLSVFVIVFVSMLYSMHKLKKENIIETLKNENI